MRYCPRWVEALFEGAGSTLGANAGICHNF